ncbi:MAG: RtcB family protein [Chloroflexi bacterium]|nr:RtcB family protein [Chloroflexota bacterium]
MVSKSELRKLSDVLYEIPKGYRPDMRVPARVYADDDLLEMAMRDRSMEQLINTATLPGVVRYALAMPDMHQGYGFPIGGVAATLLPNGVISPGGVGYDINCGVRLLSSAIRAEEIKPYIQQLMSALFKNVPSGVGRGGDVQVSARDLDEVLEQGSRWAKRRGYATDEDLAHTEEGGSMAGGDASKVSQRAKKRANDQVGTLGSGNHFLEIDEIVEVYDEEVAKRFGLRVGDIAVWIHSGSRAMGHQICTDYVSSLQSAVDRYKIRLPDRELVCAPFDSPEGQAYFAAMVCAANYAWANRQVMTYLTRRTFEEVLGGKVKDWHLRLIYDVAHNIAKIEEYEIDGQKVKLCVHRKGATRSFGPGHSALPPDYRDVGQPVLIPGDMGTASYVLVGTKQAMEESFGSTCHGAGRVASRAAAKRQIRGEQLRAELEQKGIVVKAGSMAGLAEEAPDAYKDIDRVVEVVHKAGLARKVARLEPIGVMKG